MAKNGSDIGILLVSHGELGKEFLKAAELIYQQPIANATALSVLASHDREQVSKLVEKSVTKLAKKSKQIIVLCDANGATASRIVSELKFKDIQLRCLYGINLPMLLDCVNVRTTAPDLEALAEQVCQTGRKAICSNCNGGKS